MRNFLNNWRYYGLGRDEYLKCRGLIFANNITGLCKANLVVAILTSVFAVFSIVTENRLFKAGFYAVSTVAAVCIFIFAFHKHRQLKQGKQVNEKLVYILLFLYFANVMILGLYLAVWADPHKITGSFIGILICVLFLFNISPVLYLGLMLGAVAIYLMAVIQYKDHSVWNYDIQNALFSIAISLIFGWEINKNRMTMALTVSKLEDENTIDALTQLKNRRDFTQTFQRYISNYRQSDNFLCIAILDIDFFKKYNDHYGHPQGDECLRAIGKALNDLRHSMNVYAARIGGEEFALLWFESEAANANSIALLANKMIYDLNIPHEKSKAAPYITVSIGLHISPCGVSHDMHTLYDMADKALYNAKRNGRNRTVVSS